MWLHTYGNRRSCIEKENHSNFQKEREIKERKVDFLHEIEFWGGWYKYKRKKWRLQKWRKKKERKWGIFPFRTDLGFRGWYIYVRKDVGKEGRKFLGLPLWKSTQELERGDCSQNYPGTLMVTLGVLIHIWFLHLVISEYSMHCWLVWTKKATSCLVEIGCMLVCLVLIMIPLCVVDACWNMWLCA